MEIYNIIKAIIPSRLRVIIKTPFVILAKLLIYIEAIIITPLLFIKYNKTLSNKLIFPFYHHSFGHTITGIDCIARLFFPDKITLIVVPHPNSNKFLIECFHKSYDIFYFNYLINFSSFVNSASLRIKVVKIYLNLIVNFKSEYQIINSFERFYGVMSKTPMPCLAGDETNDISIPYINISGYSRLVENKIGIRPRLPKVYIDLCINRISEKFPLFFDKPFVTLLLRSKAKNSSDFSNVVRNTNQENYINGVLYAISKGYNIVGTGDTNSDVFKHIESYYDFSDLELPNQLLNIFLITECSYFIGQQSGPFALANSCGINSLIIDSWPFRIGSFLKGDICLYKKVYDQNNEEINLKELFLYHKDLCLGYGYNRKNIRVVDNDEYEIFQSFVEFFSENDFVYDKIWKSLLNIVPDYMPFKYAPSRPPSFVLSKLNNL